MDNNLTNVYCSVRTLCIVQWFAAYNLYFFNILGLAMSSPKIQINNFFDKISTQCK